MSTDPLRYEPYTISTPYTRLKAAKLIRRTPATLYPATMSDMRTRWKQAMTHRSTSYENISDSTGIPETRLRTMIDGDRTPTLREAADISSALGYWLARYPSKQSD